MVGVIIDDNGGKWLEIIFKKIKEWFEVELDLEF